MRLPNAHRAFVDIVKLTDYCLSPVHPRGRHKAHLFAQVLGLTADRAEELRQMLLAAANEAEAQPGPADEYGRRYVVDFEVETPLRTATVRSAWIVRADEDFPRFTSCYVLEEGSKR
jgi:hypothetical protein